MQLSTAAGYSAAGIPAPAPIAVLKVMLVEADPLVANRRARSHGTSVDPTTGEVDDVVSSQPAGGWVCRVDPS